MSMYAAGVTQKGIALFTKVLASKASLTFCGAEVGSGDMPEGKTVAEMTGLVEPVAEATTNEPSYDKDTVSLTVEYRNDLNGGLAEGFYIKEFCVNALDPDDGSKVCVFYGSLSAYPQYIPSWKEGETPDSRQYPISITVGEGQSVTVNYKPGSFITAADAKDILSGLVDEAIEGLDVGGALITEITIPATGWTAVEYDETAKSYDEWRYVNTVSVTGATAAQYPDVTLHKDALATAQKAEMCPVAESGAGTVTFWAKSAPTADMSATLALVYSGGGSGGSGGGTTYTLPVATATTLGGIKVGTGLKTSSDGTLSIDDDVVATDADVASSVETSAASDEEVEAVINEKLGE